jgi:hypothetical protein
VSRTERPFAHDAAGTLPARQRRALLESLALLAALPVAGLPAARAAAPAARAGLVPHAGIDLRLDPAARTLVGRIDWRLPAGPEFALLLDRSLRIDAVQAGDGLARPLVDHDEQGRWRIRLASRARETTLRVGWSGTLAPLDPSIDHRRVLGALPPMLSADGGWLPAGSAWYPEPGRPFTYQVTVDAGPRHRALAPGRLVAGARTPGAPGSTYASHAAEDGLTVMSGPWIVTAREAGAGGGPRLLTWFTPATQSLAETYLDAADLYIARFARRMGPYPFDAFSIVAAPLPAGFALPGLTWVGERLLPLPFMRGQSLAHEIAHNWWGNGVRVDAGGGNWSEGLVTWLADHALRVEQSEAAGRRMRWGWLREQAALDPAQDMPLSRFLWRTHAAAATVGYGRAAMLFHMIAGEIGEPAFDRALRALMASHLGRRARWEDLQSAFERAAGRSLGALMPPMIALTGAPAFGPVSARWDSESRSLRLRLAQRAPYGVRARIRLRSTVSSRDLRIAFAAGADQARIALPAGDDEPLSLQFDPGFDLWRGLLAAEQPALLRDVQVAARAQWRTQTADAGWEAAAKALAARLLEAGTAGVGGRLDSPLPLLIAGAASDLAALGARDPALARPAALGDAAEVELWAARGTDGAPRLLVSAESLAALERLLPRLAHYGGEGYVSFRAGKVATQGTGSFEAPTIPIAR